MREMIGRLMDELAQMGRDTAGGYTRLAFGKADCAIALHLASRMEQAGLVVRYDAFGNVFARTRADEQPAVLLGSHTDSVPCGGNYDGIVGVVCAIAVACKAKREKLSCPVEVVIFRAEESSRFGVANLGSKAMTGRLPSDVSSRYRDGDGRTLGEAMTACGLVCENAVYQQAAAAFFEMHIEQGRVLEESGCPLGIVTAIAAPHRYRLTVAGRADHSGATPMHLRADALAGASEMILAAEAVGQAYASQDIVATVGHIEAMPNVMNVIAGKVVLSLDVRGTDKAAVKQAAEEIVHRAGLIADRRGLVLSVDTLSEETPVQMDSRLVDTLSQAADELGERSMRLVSGAGHDASYMTHIVPTAMLFVPSRAGISHNPEEYTALDDIVRGAEVLYRAVEKLSARNNMVKTDIICSKSVLTEKGTCVKM